MKTKHRHAIGLTTLALLVPASADILYSNFQNISIPDTYAGVYLDLQGAAGSNTSTDMFNPVAGWDINPFFGGQDVASSPAFQPVRSATGSSSAIVNLAAGSTINSGGTFTTEYGGAGYGWSDTHLAASFTAGTEGYIGFRINNVGYGWMRVVLGGASPVIEDWAYDTSGNGGSIVAGRIQQSAPSGNAQLVTLSPQGAESFTLGSVIANSGAAGIVTNSVLKTGAGTTVLTGANTYSGATTVTGGTLALSGSASLATTAGINIQSGASFDVTALSGPFALGATQTLQGAGTLNATGRNIAVAGTIVPGNGVGQMSVSTNTLQFGSASALDISMTQGVTPSAVGNYGQLGLTGGISITPGASLNLTALGTGAWHLGDIYYLINNDGTDAISGAFTGYAEGASFSFASQLFKVTYQADAATTSFTNGNDMALQVIPETSASLLGGLGLLTLLRLRRA